MKNSILYFQFFHRNKLYLIPLGLILILFVLSLQNRVILLFPVGQTTAIEAFDDSKSGGNSQVDHFSVDSSGATIRYTLRNKIQFAYSGIKIPTNTNGIPRDFSAFDRFVLDINALDSQGFIIHLHTIIDGYTKENDALSFRFMEKICEGVKGLNRFDFPIADFKEPNWWYSLNKMTNNSLSPETYEKVAEIIVENGANNKRGVPHQFTIKKLALEKSVRIRAIWALIAASAWGLIYCFCYLLFKTEKRQEQRKVTISYRPLDVGNNSDDYFSRIVAIIAKSYHNPDLTVKQIAHEVGLHPAKITQTLREKKNCSYKQYLNMIRISEAKRLLRETDRNIEEVARLVGYSNATHFNRTFKDAEGLTPGQFKSSVQDDQ